PSPPPRHLHSFPTRRSSDLAAAEVAKSAPDGYTLMLTTNTPHAANPSLFKKLTYDPVKDFTPITRYGTTSFMLMVRPDFPAKDLKSFIAHARSQPGKLSAGYGSAALRCRSPCSSSS